MFEIDDTLRICPKCRAKTEFDGEVNKCCPKCQADVWFYHFRKLPPLPTVPPLPAEELWPNPNTKLLFVAAGIFGLTALIAFLNSAVVALASTLGAVTFAIAAFVRHKDALKVEQIARHTVQLSLIADLLAERCAELTTRYQYLLRTGDTRITDYFERFKAAFEAKRVEADNEIQQAEQRRLDALRIAKSEQTRASQVERNCNDRVADVEERIYRVAEKIIADNLKWSSSKLRADLESYHRQKGALEKTFSYVERIGYPLPPKLRQTSLEDLKVAYAAKVREQGLKDEQKRIRQQALEEARDLKLQEQREREAREAEAQEAELAERLANALAKQHGIYSSEVEKLKSELAEAQAKSERAKSLAQLTKVGHVYILSNIGSMGENIFKVGMTRRENPEERVHELGDASVPFPFDVHAMVSCNNAPQLENQLHKELTRYRVNRVNFRKEYFAVGLETILAAVEKHHGKIDYVAEPAALQYRESLNISPEELVELAADLEEMGVDMNEDDELDVVTGY